MPEQRQARQACAVVRTTAPEQRRALVLECATALKQCLACVVVCTAVQQYSSKAIKSACVLSAISFACGQSAAFPRSLPQALTPPGADSCMSYLPARPMEPPICRSAPALLLLVRGVHVVDELPEGEASAASAVHNGQAAGGWWAAGTGAVWAWVQC